VTELNWQKSTYSESASSCVYIATTPAGTILLRESDAPEIAITTGPHQLNALIVAVQTLNSPEER